VVAVALFHLRDFSLQGFDIGEQACHELALPQVSATVAFVTALRARYSAPAFSSSMLKLINPAYSLSASWTARMFMHAPLLLRIFVFQRFAHMVQKFARERPSRARAQCIYAANVRVSAGLKACYVCLTRADYLRLIRR
jgi:hypothetical protein